MGSAIALPSTPGGHRTMFHQITILANRIALACAVVGGLGTVGIMLLINADVVGRGLLSMPVPATAEIVSASIVSIVFMQLPFATAMGRNVRSDMLMTLLRNRSPRMEMALDLFHHLVGAVILAVLLRYIWPQIYGAIDGHETVGLYGVFTVPRWPFVVAVLIGCALTLLQYVLLTASLAINLFSTRGAP